MTVEPGALRAIADELEAAQTLATDRLRAILNGEAGAEYSSSIPASASDSQIPTDATTDGIQQPPIASPAEPSSRPSPMAHKPTSRAAPPANDTGEPINAGALTCRKCGRAFPKGKGIRTHERWCNGGLASAQDRSASKVRPLRAHHSYLCPYCNRAFDKLTDLDEHKLTHPALARGRPVGAREPVIIESRGGA